MAGKHGSPAERFWRHVDKQISGCWIWTGAPTDRGYGQLCVSGRMVYAHRFAWELAHGTAPAGGQLCHRGCRPEPNPLCVNPAHLVIATNKQSRENRPIFCTNTSGARGVYADPRYGKWRAQVGHHGRRVFIGAFVSCEDAGTAARDVRTALFTHNFIDRAGVSALGTAKAAEGCKVGLPGQVSQDCGQPTGRSSVLCDDHFDAILDKALAGAPPAASDSDLAESA
jgi:hypothetical protein